MIVNPRSRRLSHVFLCLSTAGFAAVLGLVIGCPGTVTPEPPDDGGDGGAGQTTARIISPTTGFSVSRLDEAISVIYDLPMGATDVSGFRVEVEGPEPTSARVGDPVVIATDLPVGQGRAFSFNPGEAGVGFFRVGVTYTLDGQQLEIESQGIIQVRGAPDPIFTDPSQPITSVEQGDTVLIAFDVGDPEADATWRLFRVAEGQPLNVPADQLGTQLAVGAGNQGQFSMTTAGLLPGDYQLGLSATDSGFSVAATVARGQSDRIATIPNENVSTPIISVVEPDTLEPPTIAITEPGSSDVTLFRDDPFTIEFQGETFEEGGESSIEVFYDDDRDVTNGFTTIADGLPVTATSVDWPVGVSAGTHNIGARIRDGITAPVTAYASGQITVIREVTLDVLAPTSSLPVTPGTPVNVSWTTNAPESAGTVEVFRRTVNSAGEATGPEIPILEPTEPTTTSAQFTSDVSGRFQVTVRLNVRNDVPVEENAPALVRFSTLPGIVWLGSLADPEGDVEGAIFGGVNFEDNAGSAFTSAGDLDGDGLDDFVIAARYGKPFFLNPTGVGPGEAYLIYGRTGANRLRGEFNLNSVGTSRLRGITFTGIPNAVDLDPFDPEEIHSVTDGLADVQWIPDADGDGKRELVFGFPRTASLSVFPLERDGQFLNGGVVIVSSKNPELLQSPETLFLPVIDLWRIGHEFTNRAIAPPPESIVLDTQEFQPPDPDGEVEGGCVEGSDGVLDTIVGPSVGFVDILAESPVDQLGLEIIDEDVPEADGICQTVVQDPSGACVTPSVFGFRIATLAIFSGEAPGSGFYPDTSVADGHFGARIIGQTSDERFGTSITFSRSSPFQPSGELIISAPDRSFETSEFGIAYMLDNRNLWEPLPGEFGGIPPMPHQYVPGVGHCGPGRTPNLDLNPVVGDLNDHVEIVLGIPDFNRDTRGDFVVGAPMALRGDGRVYIAFRRELFIEGIYFLFQLGLRTDDPERLDGILVRGEHDSAFGASLAGEVDLNNDGTFDLAVGAPMAEDGLGEVVVLLGGTGVVTPENGYSYEELLGEIRASGNRPVAVRIQGNRRDPNGQFGFNVANAGDVDGDGLNDLLIGAPNATPRFDSTPNDTIDDLDEVGIDADMDGVADEVPGGVNQAGLVYVIYSSNRLDQIRTCRDCSGSSCTGSARVCTNDEDCDGAETCGSHDFTINIDQLGTSQLRGFIVAGRGDGDRIGGGDAGAVTQGGNSNKVGRGRSFGLGSAGDVDGDGRDDFLIGAILADPRRDGTTQGLRNGGETYLLYGSAVP